MAGLQDRQETGSRRARMLRTALGPAISTLLRDPGVIEVMLNPDGRNWVGRLADRRRTYIVFPARHRKRRLDGTFQPLT